MAHRMLLSTTTFCANPGLRSSPTIALPVARRGLICRATAAAIPVSNNGSSHDGRPAAPSQVAVASIAPVPAPAAPLPGVLPPPAAYQSIVTAGAAKAAMPAWKTLAMGILAGCYISFGGFMAVTMATMVSGMGFTNPIFSRLAMGTLFPFGLLITLVVGAELYTGNTALVTAAVYEKKASLKDLVKNWVCSYTGNLIGSLLMVALVAGTGLLATSSVPAYMATAKTSLPWMQAFIRGVLCNWLVCCAVWMASAATSLPGKMLAAYLPVMAFVTMGLEHSVANMFFIPLGLINGSQATWGAFFANNLLPVTLGNTVAGVLCMATAYAFTYGSLGPKPKEATK